MSDELRTVGDNLRLSGNYFAIDRIIINLYLQGNPSVVSLVSAIVVSLERRTYQTLQPLYAKIKTCGSLPLICFISFHLRPVNLVRLGGVPDSGLWTLSSFTMTIA
ncbi:hypothetical protein RRG08_010056 [Elysia crispata]|uniref:Uncharacterized protein n=1 Tax=Elysia crispata TaxID=231223 RepID=A0AAE1B9M6_9GAST|nr:hypothetical protein RRG08_010056 [Elysia crispata]